MSEHYSEQRFRAYCEENGLLERDLSRGLVNERIPAKEEQEARESYYEYMKRRSREEDEKMRIPQSELDAFVEEEKRSRDLPSAKAMLSSNTMDEIAKDALIWHRDSLIDDMIAFEDEDESNWVHPDDYGYKSRLVVSLNRVLDYFGVESKGTLDRRKELG
jgi:hypothetical protein